MLIKRISVFNFLYIDSVKFGPWSLNNHSNHNSLEVKVLFHSMIVDTNQNPFLPASEEDGGEGCVCLLVFSEPEAIPFDTYTIGLDNTVLTYVRPFQ